MKSIIAGAALLALSVSSFAALVDKNWEKGAFGDITLDTETNLEWLDLTITTTKSRNEVSGLLGIGRLLEGWRFATLSEWTALINNASMDPALVNTGYHAQLYNPILELMERIGTTYRATRSPATHGFIAENYGSNNARFVYMEAREEFGTGRLFNNWSWSPDRGIHIGSYLVRANSNVVPIPAAAWLFLTAIGGLIGVKWRLS